MTEKHELISTPFWYHSSKCLELWYQKGNEEGR